MLTWQPHLMSQRHSFFFISKGIHPVAQAKNLDAVSVFLFPEPKSLPTPNPSHHQVILFSRTVHLIDFHCHYSIPGQSALPWTTALGSLLLFLFLPNKPITFKTKLRTCLFLCLNYFNAVHFTLSKTETAWNGQFGSAYLSNLIPLIPLSHHSHSTH